MAYNSKYTGEQVEELLDKVYTFNIEDIVADVVANVATVDIGDMPYVFGVDDGNSLIKAVNPHYETERTLEFNLIVNSGTVNVQFGWQDPNGEYVDRTFNLNGNTYNSGTSPSNYSTYSNDASYNISAQLNAEEKYVFYVNVAGATQMTDASLQSTMPSVNLFNCFRSLSRVVNIESARLNVCNLYNTFYGCYNLASLDGIANWNTSKVTDMTYTFGYCNNLTSLAPLANWNMSNVETLHNTFMRCYNVVSLDGLANWNVAKVTNMAYTFSTCNSLTSLNGIANWNTANVVTMGNMFGSCTNLTSIEPIANWNIASVDQMNGTFYNCQSVASLAPLANWNVAKVTNMSYLFYRCSNITSLEPIANWNVAKVTNMCSIFGSMENITSIEPVANWNIASLTGAGSLFMGCTNLTSIEPLANWNIAGITNIEGMFNNCTNLISLAPLANWDVANVRYMGYLCNNCTNLTTHGFNSWTGANANCSRMFMYCDKLDDIQIHWNITNAANMFANRNTPLNVYASTVTNAYNAIFEAMGNSTTNENWNVTLYELNE